MTLKITSWNIEHSHRLGSEDPSAHDLERIRRLRQTLTEIEPDVICLVEGPKGEVAIRAFCDRALENNWKPVLLSGPQDGSRDSDYETKGTQWIWFLVREPWFQRCELQAPQVWQCFTERVTWDVHYWGDLQSSRHSHYRHPQTLRVDVGGETIELIGLHLKSKINRNAVSRDADGNIVDPYLEEALIARIKLATEARNVRRYIDARFNQSPAPGIVVMGDANDGPGQDWFEQNYMFFDLVSNLQGNVFEAHRYLNHALFDFPDHLSWTAKYRDPVLEIPESQNPLLIDHILMSQPLVNGDLPLQAEAGAGRVEHEAFERGNAGSSSKTRTSDHRPVSLVLTPKVQ